MIALRIDTRSGVPPYLQIAQQIRQALVAGVLAPGDQLPTVKEVVTHLAVNPNTVFKGYRELEREGLVEGRPGVGTFVLRRPPGPPPGTHALLARGLARWVERARAAGLDDRSIESLLRETLHARDAGVHGMTNVVIETIDLGKRYGAYVGTAQLLDRGSGRAACPVSSARTARARRRSCGCSRA